MTTTSDMLFTMATNPSNTSDLLSRFVEAFEVLDDRQVFQGFDADGDLQSLIAAPWDDQGWSYWRPLRTDVPRTALADDLGPLLPRPLPPLYEQLVLSYRWAEVDLGRLRLLSNLPPGLKGLSHAIRRDQCLYQVLSAAGYLQFGKGPDIDYDPVCFDLRTRPSGDCRIVKFDHEQILCNERLVEVAELAPSFKQLIQLVIEDAHSNETNERGCSHRMAKNITATVAADDCTRRTRSLFVGPRITRRGAMQARWLCRRPNRWRP